MIRGLDNNENERNCEESACLTQAGENALPGNRPSGGVAHGAGGVKAFGFRAPAHEAAPNPKFKSDSFDDDKCFDGSSRDPYRINAHCLVKFEDIIAEPDPTVFSFDGVWTLSYKVFTSTKLWCYRITSLICAIPAAICWGIEFACLSFCTIWCWQPSLKAYEISLWYTRRLFEIFLAVFFEPCFHAMGKCLSHIVVTVKREG